MPWKEFLVSEARVQFVLACKGEGESFASICCRFGISRKTGYKWSKRYRAGGLKAMEDASRRPQHRGKMYHFCWHERLRKARRARAHWGAKKLRWRLQKAFPRAKRIPAVSTLARWLLEHNLVKKPKRRARPGPVLPGRGVRAAKSCNEVWTIDFKGWFRTGDGRRCEPLTVRDLHSRFVLAVALLSNQSDPGGQWSALCRQWGLGAVALERVVAAPGHCGGLCPASASPGQRRARTNASGVKSRSGRTTCAQRAGAEAARPNLDRSLQSRASSRGFGPTSARSHLSAERTRDAPATQSGEISAKLESAAGAQSRAHQMARAPALCRKSLCGRDRGTQNNGRCYPGSLSRAAFNRIALRSGPGRNATGLYSASSMKLRACPSLGVSGSKCNV
jgi:transposase